MAAADRHKLPAGGALAVDREGFSAAVTARLEAHPLITIDRREVDGLPPEDWDSVIIATGPLTSPALAGAIRELTGDAGLAFFDAIAPIVYRESIDFSWPGSSRATTRRAGRRGGRLHQLPDGPRPVRRLHRGADRRRRHRLQGLGSEHALFRRLPAHRGHGGARPRDPAPRADEAARPHQRAQAPGEGLRRRPAPPGQCARHALQHGRLPDEAEIRRAVRIFRTIPGLEKAEFARLGGLHRNTFLNSPRVLDDAAAQGHARACALPGR
jgi:methylenetetrahydrofolate--tRNA-(uracil-5-)-methyltransferase